MRTGECARTCCTRNGEDVPQWLPTGRGDEEAYAIQVGSPTGAYSLVHDGRGAEQRFEAYADGEDHTQEGDDGPGLLSGESVEGRQPRWSQQAYSSVVRRTREIGATPKRFPSRAATSSGTSWTVSAPKVDRAVRELSGCLKRAPTDCEVAAELNLSLNHYHEGLTLLNDIGIEILPAGVTHVGTQLVPKSRGFEHAVFCCLRSEMLALFRSAVEDLPRDERLDIALEYCEGILGTEINITLRVAESTSNDAGSYSRLHLRARLFGSHECDHYGRADDVTPAFGRRPNVKKPTGREAHIYMTAGQDGWLRKGYVWESLGQNVTYNHLYFKWFCACDDGGLELVKKYEKKEIKYEEERMMPC